MSEKFEVVAVIQNCYGVSDWEVIFSSFDSETEAQEAVEVGKRDNPDIKDWATRKA